VLVQVGPQGIRNVGGPLDEQAFERIELLTPPPIGSRDISGEVRPVSRHSLGYVRAGEPSRHVFTLTLRHVPQP
jgi:hypothetical protein